jgi:hypothetical protein
MTKLSVGLHNERIRYRATTGKPMYSKKQFAALEAMCREQALKSSPPARLDWDPVDRRGRAGPGNLNKTISGISA